MRMSCIEADSKIIGLYEKLFAKNVKKKFLKKSHNTILIIDPTMKFFFLLFNKIKSEFQFELIS